VQVDTHIHLDLLPDAVPLPADPAWRGLVPATTPASARRALNRWADDPRVAVAAGLHPWWAAGQAPGPHGEQGVIPPPPGVEPGPWSTLRALVGEARVVAVGEIGLDFLRTPPHAPGHGSMQAWCSAQMALARDHDLPVILHVVRAHAAARAMVQQAARAQGAPVRGIVHAFSGSREEALAWIRLGFVLGLGPLVTRPRARVGGLVPELPAGTWVLETDAPSMVPSPGVAGQGRPEDVARVTAAVARLRGSDVATVEGEHAVALRRLGMRTGWPW
jgi:TatD DNase family protein